MLQFNNNHIFTGYLKQFLSSFNLPVCKIYTAEFEKYFAKNGTEDPRVIESSLPIVISAGAINVRPAVGVTYLKNGNAQQYFWNTDNWQIDKDRTKNRTIKYWNSNKAIHYNGNRIPGLTKTLKNPTTLYDYQTHEYLGDYLRFLRDFENINLMSMYNCFNNRICNNIKTKQSWKVPYFEINQLTGNKEQKEKTVIADIDAYNTQYKIYMLPVKLFEKYTIAIDCYQGIELFCGLYNDKLDLTDKATDLIKRTYCKIPKALFNQPFIYDKLDVSYWNWDVENTVNDSVSIMNTTSKILRSELAMRESELKLFIKIPANNTSSITILEGDYRNFNDSLYTIDQKNGWKYFSNSTVANFETKKCVNCKTCVYKESCTDKTSPTCKNYSLPDINLREFKPISKLQLLALNTGISYPFADRLIEYLVANVIVPNDATPDNIKRLQKVMEDCGYTFQIDGVWEPKMQMILYDYLMNSGKFITIATTSSAGYIIDKVKDKRDGNLRQIGQRLRTDFYDILGYGDKDAEKLYASWTTEVNNKTNKSRAVTKTTLENVDIYSNLYNN